MTSANIYLVGTVGKNYHVQFRIRKGVPKNLKPNEFGYRLMITIDFNAWRDRLIDVPMPNINPKPPVSIAQIDGVIGKSIKEQVLEKLKG